jgi:ankyrin repeat protein
MQERDADGLTPLHLAAERGDGKEVARLLEGGADLFTVESKMGVSVSHRVHVFGQCAIFNLLLELEYSVLNLLKVDTVTLQE